MRPEAFVVPFKETTIEGRSGAIGLRGDQPLGCPEANMIWLILLDTKHNSIISRFLRNGRANIAGSHQ